MNQGLSVASWLCYFFSFGLYVVGILNLKEHEPQSSGIYNELIKALKKSLIANNTSKSTTVLVEIADAYSKLNESIQHRIPWYDKAVSRLGIIAFLAMATTSVTQFATQGVLSKEASFNEKRLEMLNDDIVTATSNYHAIAHDIFKSTRAATIPDFDDARSRQRQLSALAATLFEIRQDFNDSPSDEDFLNWAVDGEQWHVVKKILATQKVTVSWQILYKVNWFNDELTIDEISAIRNILDGSNHLESVAIIREETPSLICYLLHKDKIFRKPLSRNAIESGAGIDIEKIASFINLRPDELLTRIQGTSTRLIDAKTRYQGYK